MPETSLQTREARLSECGRYRYWLFRWWRDGPKITALPFLMLNPSTADDVVDDPTIRRCRGFAAREGYGGIAVLNLYAWRATDPAELLKASDPVGPDNDRWLTEMFSSAQRHDLPIVCAWGANARPDRVQAVLEIARRTKVRLVALGVTKEGHPRHPLYLRSDAPLVPWPVEQMEGV